MDLQPTSNIYQIVDLMTADEISVIRMVPAYAESKINGIVANSDIERFFADGEALHSYEGTYRMQTLVVGKTVAEPGAFV